MQSRNTDERGRGGSGSAFALRLCGGLAISVAVAIALIANALAGAAAEPAKGITPAPAGKPVVVESATVQSSPAQPLLFRRTYVPADRIDDWPRGNLRYLPMDADEFARAVQSPAEAPTDNASLAAAQLVHAAYEARLAGNELIDGHAALEVQRSPSATAAGRHVLLVLGACGLAIDSPRWSTPAAIAPPKTKLPTTNGKAAEPTKAIFGATADGHAALLVDRSSTLDFAWSLRGQRETGGELTFALQLPRCASNRLTLTLPTGLAPVVGTGIVVPVEEPAATSSQSRRWQIELGGQTNAVLRILKEELVEKPHSLTLVRQSSTYEFSSRGTQLAVEWKLDILGDPIREIPLWIDAPLEVVTARCGDIQIPWIDAQRSPARSTGAKRRRIVLQFAEPLRGKGRSVRLAAMAPLPTSRSLPGVQLASEAIFWQEGTASLLVSAPLEIRDLKLGGCRQTKAEPLAAPLAGEAIVLQYFQAAPRIELSLQQRPDRFQAHSGTTLEVRGATLTGSVLADVTAADGECFAIAASVSPSWMIDSVESVPAGAIAGWARGSDGRLSISLNRAVRPEHPLRLAVAGHWRRRPLGERLHIQDLDVVRWDGIDDQRHVFSIHAATPYRLRLTGDAELNRLDPSHLSAGDAALLGSAPGELTFVADAGAADVAVAVNSEPPKLSGDIHLDVHLTDDSLTETYTLACSVESADLDRALVRFSKAAPEPLRWSFSSPGKDVHELAHEVLSARRLSAEEQATLGVVAGGELWEVTWPQSPGPAFTLEAVRTIPLAKSLPIGLASLAQANSQFGTVTIRSSAERVPQIENRRLKPAAPPAPVPGRWPDALAAFTYEPQEAAVMAASDPNPSLSIHPAAALPAACVWSARLDSHYLASGVSEHVAILRIENNGRRAMAIQMPAATALHAASVDGVLIPPPTKAAPGAKLSLELPMGERFPTVVLQWAVVDSRLGLITNREAELPQCDMPVLSRRVNVWLPPQYRLVDGSGLTELSAAASWSERLFGPFGRPAGEAAVRSGAGRPVGRRLEPGAPSRPQLAPGGSHCRAVANQSGGNCGDGRRLDLGRVAQSGAGRCCPAVGGAAATAVDRSRSARRHRHQSAISGGRVSNLRLRATFVD